MIMKLYQTQFKCAEVMNNFFSNAAINLDIDCIPRMLPAMQAIEKYKYHHSIIKIQEQGFIQATFNFSPISILDMQKEFVILIHLKHTRKKYFTKCIERNC